MVKAVLTDEQFAIEFKKLGASGLATKYALNLRNVNRRRRLLERRDDMIIDNPTFTSSAQPRESIRRSLEINDGVVIVGGDCHYWPREISTAHQAFVDVCKKIKPKLVVMNGDVFDGARISRHPPLGYSEHLPSVVDELQACQSRLMEIRNASKKSKHYWLLGNHDARFERRIATMTPELVGVEGVHLKDHFPDWITGMSLWINEHVVIKHNWKGGVHSRHNNAVNSGKTVVTGHTHQQGATPWVDYNGLRYGIESGTMAEPYSDQFLYADDNPRNWVSGFVVLTFFEGKLLEPEFVKTMGEGRYQFRGEVVTLKPLDDQ